MAQNDTDIQDLLTLISSNINSSTIVNAVFRQFYSWHKSRFYNKSDYVLENVPIVITNLDVLVGLLTVTYPVKHILKNREEFYLKVESMLTDNKQSITILKGLK